MVALAAVALAAAVVKLTPSTKDDEVVGKISRVLNIVAQYVPRKVKK
jgi:hypothetical protein